MVRIHSRLEIPDGELRFVTSRSSGPGGQNVNKVETRVTLLFDTAGSPTLSEDQRRRIAERLAGRIGRDGVLRVTAQRHRSQSANRELVVERFRELLREALARRKPRRPTRPSAAAERRRLEEKRRRSEVKRRRRGPEPPTD
jgi:ribosome-associated protein